ncbi:MAG: YybH family protein [Candidatus Binataceae bacterium]
MKRIGLTIGGFAGAAILVWSLGFNARASTDPKAEIMNIETKALAANTADELIAFYDPNDIITYDYIPGLQYVGYKAVHEDLDKFFAGTKDVKGTFADIQIETDGTMAVAHSLQHFTWKDKNGVAREAMFRVTNCYHKTNGQWKIFHMHTSFPIDPATGRAQMNLTK